VEESANKGPNRDARAERAAKRAELERELKALTPEQRQSLARVNRFVFGFGLCALVMMVTLTMRLPWPAIGLAALVAAIVVGIRGIILARTVPLAKGVVVYLSLGLALVGLFAVYSVPLIVTWSDQWRYQQCLNQTQTIQGQDSCRDEFEEATEVGWSNFLRRLTD
jgi:hypothetical protein